MDAVSGFRVLTDEFISNLLAPDKIAAVIRAANNLKQHGYVNGDRNFYKVEGGSLMKLVDELTRLKISETPN